MGFRTVVVNSRSKLEARLNSLIVRGEQERRIHISEINTLIVQSTAVSMTAALLSELVKNSVKVIFCDEKHNPLAELLPYYGAHNTSKRYKEQLSWTDGAKGRVWQDVIRRKITEQARHLMDRGYYEQADLVISYVSDVAEGDVTNREGHAAKVYFNCLLGPGSSRNDGSFVNGCLNYGYAVLLSAFNREIVSAGYLTQLGIWHDNEFNQFNLSCDLMEPLRIAVDRTAMSLEDGDKEFKRRMANVLNYYALIDGKRTTLDVAIRTYVRSVLHALHEDRIELICYPEQITVDE